MVDQLQTQEIYQVVKGPSSLDVTPEPDHLEYHLTAIHLVTAFHLNSMAVIMVGQTNHHSVDPLVLGKVGQMNPVQPDGR